MNKTGRLLQMLIGGCWISSAQFTIATGSQHISDFAKCLERRGAIIKTEKRQCTVSGRLARHYFMVNPPTRVGHEKIKKEIILGPEEVQLIESQDITVGKFTLKCAGDSWVILGGKRIGNPHLANLYAREMSLFMRGIS